MAKERTYKWLIDFRLKIPSPIQCILQVTAWKQLLFQGEVGRD